MFDREWILSVARQRLALQPDLLAELEWLVVTGSGQLPASIITSALADQEHDRLISTAIGMSSGFPRRQRSCRHLVKALDSWAARQQPGPVPEVEPLPGARAPLVKLLKSAETSEGRQARRLKRFRDLGGALRRAGQGWHCVPRGILTKLVREEQQAGKARSKRQDVKRDLDRAMEKEQS